MINLHKRLGLEHHIVLLVTEVHTALDRPRIKGGCVTISAIFKGLFTFFKPLFLQNRNTSIKSKY